MALPEVSSSPRKTTVAKRLLGFLTTPGISATYWGFSKPLVMTGVLKPLVVAGVYKTLVMTRVYKTPGND